MQHFWKDGEKERRLYLPKYFARYHLKNCTVEYVQDKIEDKDFIYAGPACWKITLHKNNKSETCIGVILKQNAYIPS